MDGSISDPIEELPDSAKDSRRKKRTESQITESISTWAENVKSSRRSLLSVQLSQNGEPAVSTSYLERELDTHNNTLTLRKEVFDSIISKMIEEKIIIPGYNSISNEWRRKLLNWYESLSDEDKRNIPIVANKISARRCLDKIEGMGNLKWARQKLPLVEQTFSEIMADLEALGVINIDYKTCVEREADLEQTRISRGDSQTRMEAINALRGIPLSHVNDLIESDPARPFNQLLHIFAAASLKSTSKSTILNYCEGFRYASQHLEEIGFKGHEHPKEYITPHYLTRFRNYLADRVSEDTISYYTANGLLSAARVMLKRAIRIKEFGLNNFIDTEGFEHKRKTDEYRPYTKSERAKIANSCKLEIESTNKLAEDYVPFGGGCDPVNEDGSIINGLGTLDNARWIYENKLNCQRTSRWSADPDNIYEKAFSRILNYSSLGIVDIYKSWNVLYEVTSRVLAPYVIRLAQVTGLNADSLKSLDLDDFIESHEITKRPCLRYWKERSGGEKIYHLDLMHADFKWLTTSQSREIKKIFTDVIHLTRHIREHAETSIKDRLFIYESLKANEFRKVKTFENSVVINVTMNKFSDEHDLKTDDGRKLSISASRLRPSLVAELIDHGASLRVIQVVLGHKSITTTIKYLDRLEFSKTSQAIVDEALNRIHRKTIENAMGATQEAAPEAQPQPVTPAAPIRTGLVECRNVFDPPDEIRRLANYKEGNPCSLLNKCLSCQNSIITLSNLPDLFAMRRDYRAMMETSLIAETPYGHVVQENLDVLESILTPSSRGFNAEQLANAERLSEYIITSTLVERMTI